MIQFSCPNCQSVAKAKFESAGKKGRCSKCGAIFTIPNPSVKEVGRPVRSETIHPPSIAPNIRSAFDQPVLMDDMSLPPKYLPHSSPTAVQINMSAAASNSLGITSLVLGILSLFTCWIPAIGFFIGGVSLALGIAAIIVAMKRNGSGVGYGIGGISLGGITVLGNILFIAALTIPPGTDNAHFQTSLNTSERSTANGIASFRSQKWNNLTYHTEFLHLQNDTWIERYYDGKIVRELQEVSSTTSYLELQERDRGYLVRIYPDKRDFLNQGNWQWVASGRWEQL